MAARVMDDRFLQSLKAGVVSRVAARLADADAAAEEGDALLASFAGDFPFLSMALRGRDPARLKALADNGCRLVCGGPGVSSAAVAPRNSADGGSSSASGGSRNKRAREGGEDDVEGAPPRPRPRQRSLDAIKGRCQLGDDGNDEDSSFTCERCRKAFVLWNTTFEQCPGCSHPMPLRIRLTLSDIKSIMDRFGMDSFVMNLADVKQSSLEHVSTSHSSSSSKPREIRSLRDHLPSGLHDQAPANGPLARDVATAPARIYPRSAARVCRIEWGESASQLSADEATYFWRRGSIHPALERLGRDLQRDMCSRLVGSDDVARASTSSVSRGLASRLEHPERVAPGYFKSHLREQFVADSLMDVLPPGLQVKPSAKKKAIVFVNTAKGRCQTHHDRDTSVLLVVAGRKDVMLAHRHSVPTHAVVHSNSSIYDDVDPFAGKGAGWESVCWEKISLKPGDALLIPAYWAHCVESSPDTVALSLQVARTRTTKGVQTIQALAANENRLQALNGNIDETDDDDESSVSSFNSEAFRNAHNDLCEVCDLGGILLCCASCSLVFHKECHQPELKAEPADDWSCAHCVAAGATGLEGCSKQKALAIEGVRKMKEMADTCNGTRKEERAKAVPIVGAAADKKLSGEERVSSDQDDADDEVGVSAKRRRITRASSRAIRHSTQNDHVDACSWADKKRILEGEGKRLAKSAPTRAGPALRRRIRPTCGIPGCLNGFAGDEMWILTFNGAKKSLAFPFIPTSLPKHLVCMSCLPRQDENPYPGEFIQTSSGKSEPLLTIQEFQHLDKYEYMCGSAVDYDRGLKSLSFSCAIESGTDTEVGRMDASPVVKTSLDGATEVDNAQGRLREIRDETTSRPEAAVGARIYAEGSKEEKDVGEALERTTVVPQAKQAELTRDPVPTYVAMTEAGAAKREESHLLGEKPGALSSPNSRQSSQSTKCTHEILWGDCKCHRIACSSALLSAEDGDETTAAPPDQEDLGPRENQKEQSPDVYDQPTQPFLPPDVSSPIEKEVVGHHDEDGDEMDVAVEVTASHNKPEKKKPEEKASTSPPLRKDEFVEEGVKEDKYSRPSPQSHEKAQTPAWRRGFFPHGSYWW